MCLFLQQDAGRTVSTSESVASTITAASEEDMSSSDDDNGEDNDDSSDTASAPSPPPIHQVKGNLMFCISLLSGYVFSFAKGDFTNIDLDTNLLFYFSLIDQEDNFACCCRAL